MRQAGPDRREYEWSGRRHPGPERRRVFIGPADGARRPGLPAIAWRWRYEIATALAGITVMIFSLALLGPWWTLIDITMFAMFFSACPPAREFLAARARCVITAHRVRTGCAEAYLVSRRGALPFIYSVTPAPFGERVKLWCPAGVPAEDFEAEAGVLAGACWAKQVRVVRDPCHAHLVTLEIVRHQAKEPA